MRASAIDSRLSGNLSRRWFVERLAELLGESVDDITALDDDENLLGCGLDSIRLMSLLASVNRAGHALTFADLARHPSLAAWRALVAESPARRGAVEACDGRDAAGLDPGLDTDPAVDIHAPFDLSAVQQAYWLGRGDEQVLGNVACHIFIEFRCRAIDAERLEAACRLVRRRHPMLRARFEAGRQQIVDEPDVPVFDHRDWRGDTPEAAEAAWAELLAQRSHERLAVERGQVFLVGLAAMPDGSDRVWLSLDLLAADVDSVRLVMKEIGLAYADPASLPAEPSTSFPAYLARRQRLSRVARDEAHAYWRERLPQLPGAPMLPLACAPETIRAPRFVRRAFTLSHPELERLRQAAARHGVTLSSVFGCAFSFVLARWSAQDTFLLNVPLFDRHGDEADLAAMVADFTTLLLVECRVEPAVCFVDAVRGFQRRMHDAIAHAAYPALDVLREARRQGMPRAAPVVFSNNLGGDTFVPAEFGCIFGDLHEMISQTPQVWLDHQLYRVTDGVLLAWDSVDGLFAPGVIDAMFDAYLELVQGLCDRDWQSPAALPLPLDQQRRRDAANSAAFSPAPRTLHHDVFRQAHRRPDAIALRHGEHVVTRGELAARALAIAGGLKAAGIGLGDAVEVSLPRGPEQIAAVLGVLALGACYVPLDVGQPVARKALIERAAGVRAVIGATAAIDGLRCLDVARLSEVDPLPAPLAVSPRHTAYVIYTSGSTGVPKGVEMSHGAAMNTIDAVARCVGLTADDRLLAVSALDFDLSVFDLFGVLGAGGSLVIPEQDEGRDARRWIELLARHEVTVWNSAPALLEMALAAHRAGDGFRGLRAVLLSGDWIATDLPARLRAHAGDHCVVHALGGATEAGIWSNLQAVGATQPDHWRSIPYGAPLPGQAYRVVDGHGNDLPDHVAGELLIGGGSLARGYRNDSELTARRFESTPHGRWYHTGDRGRYWSDGTLELLGRADLQVKIRGHRIELGEIEVALAEHPDVESACAAVSPGEIARVIASLVPATAQPQAGGEQPAEVALARLPDTAGAEAAVTGFVLTQLLAQPESVVPAALRARWSAWLADARAAVPTALDDALSRLGWSRESLADLVPALLDVIGDAAGAQRLLLDARLAPQAMALQLPGGRLAITQIGRALARQIGAGKPSSVAVLDVRGGQMLSPGLAMLDDPGVRTTLFDSSAGLLREAAARFTRSTPALQALEGGLLPLRYLGQFDCVVSFAAAHTRESLDDLFWQSAMLLAEGGFLLLADLMRDSPLRQVSAGLFSDAAPRFALWDEISAAARRHGFVLAPDSWHDPAFFLIVARAGGTKLTESRLAEWLRDRLPEAMRPEPIWCRRCWPLNPNGKIDRRAIADAMQRADGESRSSSAAFVPANEREVSLLACWEQALGHPGNASEASFFSLGGDSLLATRFIARLHERLGVRIGMAEFYRRPTLSGMAVRLAASANAGPDGAGLEEGVL
ncbi:non-ribosomal peptide synthetase [Burkholderia plantarii]|uniref:non-ribosomal peptide synthetase n=1 Tax=Burkholderia plantarii TaxID=41899 RepID=UPI0006D89979|nr:non-ribosomal peptide synthetase [Burkholderia plantarii]ALK30699.1 dihydroaeruginoic acid synthetase PchE [Burkholderia plantarii]GLZ19314.1 pyochelin synthetase [Burkholderia plantarii]